MAQLSKSEALREAIGILASEDKSWKGRAEQLNEVYLKGGEALDGLVTALGSRFRAAIQGLKLNRCDQLNVAEISAYLCTNERNAIRYIGSFIKGHDPGKGPGDGRHHVCDEKEQRAYWKYHYHRAPFDLYLEQRGDKAYEKRRAAAVRQRTSPMGLAKRRQAAEAELREIDLVSAVLHKGRIDLVRTTLAEHPEGQSALADLAALRAKLAGMGLSVEDLVGLQTFVQAQVADITTSVVVCQPWLVDAQGRLTDHAWWTIDNDAESIRSDLVAGGTVVHMPLVEALEREWHPGDAYLVWSAMADMAAVRSMETRKRHLAAMRQSQDEGKGKDLPVKERVRS